MKNLCPSEILEQNNASRSPFTNPNRVKQIMKNNQLALVTTFTTIALSGLASAKTALPKTALPKTAAHMAKPASSSWVRLTSTTDEKRYTVGQPINVSFAAKNISKKTAYLRFTSGQRFDFSVAREGSKETVYTWSATRMFTMMTGSLTLKPGQIQRYEASIGDEMGTLKKGSYVLTARLANSPVSITAKPIRFEVIDNGLAITAKTNKLTYAAGEPVDIDVVVANRSGKQNIVPFDSGLTFDAIISDESGRQIWTYGANLRFIRALGHVTWEKGETKKYSASWNGAPFPDDKGTATLAPGRYKVQVVLQSTPRLYAAPIYIEITGAEI